MKGKSEALTCFKKFKITVEKQTNNSMKVFRIVRDGEFTSQHFNTLYKDHGVIRHLITPYMPQQNDVMERLNRTLIDITRRMLKAKQVPNLLWGEVINHATYIINQILIKEVKEERPYQLYYKQKPNIKHIRVFRCVGYAKTVGTKLRKLDDHSRKPIHLASEPRMKAYQLYDPICRKIIVSQDMIFDEKHELG